jgi:hypothetical protein
MLAAGIRRFWATAGFDVEVELVRVGNFGGNECFGLKSNLRGGLPPVK